MTTGAIGAGTRAAPGPAPRPDPVDRLHVRSVPGCGRLRCRSRAWWTDGDDLVLFTERLAAPEG
ncbi:hypothetical protein [Geodermatophilus normandii]|uniref:Uncharacterized protein n=1 Tax=Geodermatophilus normandii TaxID=1137989 RepID=A0A6P0GAJ5_9ACTN|nr:hypothetical protein [Geodermatophilus normandii]NEM04724.1 hypothetical protein [Geodermatophilus normandii]